MTRLAITLCAAVLVFAVAVSVALAIVAQSDANEAKASASRAQGQAAVAMTRMLEAEETARETAARLEDVERLVIELQDGVPEGAYKHGFPEAQSEWLGPPPEKRCATCPRRKPVAENVRNRF